MSDSERRSQLVNLWLWVFGASASAAVAWWIAAATVTETTPDKRSFTHPLPLWPAVVAAGAAGATLYLAVAAMNSWCPHWVDDSLTARWKVWRQRRQAKGAERRAARERAADDAPEVRRLERVSKVEARLQGLQTIYDRAGELRRRPSLDQVSVDEWLFDALMVLNKGERWTVLHAPYWQTAEEETSEAIRNLDAQSHGFHDVMRAVEHQLYGLHGRR